MPRDPDMVQYNVRIPRGLHADFLAACASEDRMAAQIVRDLMRTYIQHVAALARDRESKEQHHG